MLPLELKYYKLDIGESVPVREGDLPMKLYQLVNKATGIVEGEFTSLPDGFRTLLTKDRMMERVNRYLKEEGTEAHLNLDDEDEDRARPGLMIPSYLAGGGSGPQTPPFAQ